ncbi:MAG: hypothetical protein CML20_19385 [Rheinheimera sp.]|nr:hypothetical protein [Rheinheimera sp.]|tara:strand:+ start:12250 stop:12531 length:282 start_codon:yes stop_codon:yes gene_type:complete
MNKLKVMAEVGNKLNPTSRAAERAKHKASKAPTATGLPANKKLRVPCHSGKAINPADVVWDVSHWAQIQALRLGCSLPVVYIMLGTVTRGSNV